MRALIATEFMSLDGVIDSPGGEPGHRSSGWTFNDVAFDAAAYEIKGREQSQAGALLIGRVSYEAFAPVWGSMEEFAEYNAMPKHVVSTTLQDDALTWGPASILRSLDEVAALKQTDGGPLLVHGSGTLVRGLEDAGLVDRYHLLVFPLLLGAGKRMFSDADKPKRMLDLVEHETFGNGITKLVYDVIR